jgi:hypothetical protein
MRIAFALVAALTALPAFAVDGVVLINQANALAGNVTPGDTPGFPVTISQSGSYRLSSNLVITDPTGTVIQITADDVTIDLNGFSIIGPSVCNGHGITPTTSCTISNTTSVGIDASEHVGVTILNGFIRGMGFVGFVCLGDAHVEGIQAIGNASGMQANGVVVHNVADYNLIAGFNGTAIFKDNVANGNQIGFLSGLGSGGMYINNIANFNSGAGFFGQSPGTVVSGNSATRNGGDQILVACPASITGNAGAITFNGSSTGCVVANNSN